MINGKGVKGLDKIRNEEGRIRNKARYESGRREAGKIICGGVLSALQRYLPALTKTVNKIQCF
jgi:hypothetical protein